jgi:HEAT repeat protein
MTILSCIGSVAGCSLWPFAQKDHTSYATPAKRVAAVEQIGAQAAGSDAPRQDQLTLELAQKIQTEPDPIVREAILHAASKFRSQMSDRMLMAALNDTDAYVRQTACRLVSRRGSPAAIAELGRVAKADAEVDVRLAATRALGELRDASAVPYLSGGLADHDPAVQLATVEALKLASGQDLGNDVGAWREWVASRGGGPAEAAVAGRPAAGPPSF